MSQSPFLEQNVPVIEVCCLCGQPLSGTPQLLFCNEQGQARVDDDCARALRDLALSYEPGKLREARCYVQGFLPYTHPVVHGFIDQYIERSMKITGENSQPAAPQGMQTPVYQGSSSEMYPTMGQDGQGTAQPSAAYDVPQEESPAKSTEKASGKRNAKHAVRQSERAERLFRVLTRVVFAAIVGLAAALLSSRGTSVPSLPLVLGAWLTFAYTGGRWLFKIGYRIGMHYIEPMFYSDGESNIILKIAAVVLSVLFSLPFTAIVGAINGVIELYNTALGQTAQELYGDESPARQRKESNRQT